MAEGRAPRTDRDLLVMAALEAVQAFTDATDRMHGALRSDMDMNATDLAAIRMLIMRERRGELVQPHDLATHLSISTASTTKLLDRLARAGFLARQPHPWDRRARIVVLTDGARREFYRHFRDRLQRMRTGMEPYADAELEVIVRFLSDMAEAMVDAP